MNREYQKDKISVIVPVYNCRNSLDYCVNSILRQTCADFELILVDDGSTDKSDMLCDAYAKKDSRIRVIHKKNGGVSSARNAGIDKSSGEYITFCDSDDYLEPDYLETLIQTARSNPNCGHIWCCFRTVTGYQKEDAIPNWTTIEPILYYTRREYMTLHELWLDTGPCNKLYKRKAIQSAAIRFPEDLSLGEDWLFNLAYLDALPNDQIAVVTKPLYNYVRGNSESLDSKYRNDLLDIYRRLNVACFEYLRRWDLDLEQMEKFYNSRFYMYEKVLNNTMRNVDQKRCKNIAWNTSFMRSDEFKKVLYMRTCPIHPIYWLAYNSGNFRNVLLADKLCHAKHCLKKIFMRNDIKGC